MTEEEWNTNEATDIVVKLTNYNTGQFEQIGIIGLDGEVATTLDKHLARAVVVRLVELAEQLPEPPRILRRASDIDDQFKERDF